MDLEQKVFEGARRYGTRENAERDMGNYAACECGHQKALHSDNKCYSCGCTGFDKRENAIGDTGGTIGQSSLGYQYGVETTYDRPKGEVSQMFYCMDCEKTVIEDEAGDHREKGHEVKREDETANALENMACPACGENISGMSSMMDHLKIDHGMTEAQAERVLGG